MKSKNISENKITLIFVIAAIIAGLLCSLLIACTNKSPQEKRAEKLANEIVGGMSIDEKIGQIMLMEFSEWNPDDATYGNTDMAVTNEDVFIPADEEDDMVVLNNEVRSIIADFHLGNIILFGENCKDTESLARLTYDMQHAAIDSGSLPLLIGTDQEGGSVTRLVSGTCMSGNMAVGASGNTENARLSGQVIGSELAAVGINCDFAPDADVNSNRENPIIGLRSFSDDPKVVAKMAEAMAEGMADSGIIPCAKHFPGHGNTSSDSHTGLPLVEESYDEWLKCDGLPFKALAEKNSVGMIMTAHIQYPGLDDTKVKSSLDGDEIYLPATLSKTIITDILKGKLGYDGVVVTDALNMDAIVDNFDPEEAVIMALNAGADMLCMPVTIRSTQDIPKLTALYDTIKAAVADGTLSEKRLNDAARAVIKLKIESGILDRDYNYDVNAAAKEASEIVGGQDNRDIEARVAAGCVKTVYDGKFEGFNPQANDKIAVFMPYLNELNSTQYAFNQMGRDLNVNFYCYQNGLDNEMINASQNADYIILGSEQVVLSMSTEGHWLNTIPQKILDNAKTENIAILCTGLPYQAEKYSADYPCIMLYNYSGMDGADIYASKFAGKFGPAIPAGINSIFK